MPPPSAPERAVESLVEWEVDTLQVLLTLKGRALHAAIGVAEEDWRYTELDLAAIAPPLTRICNRYEPIQRLAKYSDPMTLAFALGAYGVRSLEERQAVLAGQEEEADTVPIAPAGEGSPIPPSQAPSPATAPRQASSFPTAAPGPPPAMAPSEGPAPPPAPRPAEADVDPTDLEWQVGGG
jgi:hypothetical protein